MRTRLLISLVFIAFGCTEEKGTDINRYKSAEDEEGRLIDSLGVNTYMIASITDSIGNRLLKYDCALDDTIRARPYWRVKIDMGNNLCDYTSGGIVEFQLHNFFTYENGNVSMQFPAFCDSTDYGDKPVSYRLLWFNRYDNPNRHHYFLDSLGNLSLIVKTPSEKEFYLLKPIR